MPRKPTTKSKKDPGTKVYDHTSADALVRPDVGLQAQFKNKKAPAKYEYDPTLDPQLVWAGKAERTSFEVPTLPLFVHERLSTKAILETLKGHKRDKQMTLDLFADPQLSITDRLLKAYEHRDKWANRLILGDSLVVMNSLLHYENLGGQVQMIFMDPPYGVKFGSNFQPFVRKRDVKHNDDSDLTREPETVKAYRDTWELGIHSYLSYLRDRFMVARDLLNDSGSIFVQISDTNLHLVTLALDEVFRPQNRVAVVAFRKTGFASDEDLATTHDFLLWYAKSAERRSGNQVFLNRELSTEELAFYDYIELADGARRALTKEERGLGSEVRDLGKPFARNPMVSPGWQDSLSFEVVFDGRPFKPPPNRHWATTSSGVERLRATNRLAIKGNTLRFVRFFDDFPVSQLGTVWNDTGVGGFVGDERLYVVQTDTRVVQRCILLATKPGDLVVDPTCGSGTTAYVSEQWGRRWITIDTSRVPLALARQRLLTATYPYYELKDEKRGPAGGFNYIHRQNNKGEEVGGIVRHVTLKSIANNELPDDVVLVDRPEEHKSVTRVTGPFTVEATIPTPVDYEGDGEDDSMAATASEYSDYTARMIEILRKVATIQLPGNQKVTFSSVRPPAKTLSLSAEAEVANGTAKPVAFVFGPENGAVSEKLVWNAAKEASAKRYTHLYVLGFAIQPDARQAIERAEEVHGIRATYVQATPDLLMGDLLKNMRSSQVFSVCGQPEVRVQKTKEKYSVELAGLDTFDPITMDAHHLGGDDVPCWLLDTDYNGLAFHVSQAFFPRTSAWDNLKRALKGVYEDSVWEHLSGTTSEPFEAGEHKQVAVKVIDDRGNELLVVKELV